MKKIYQKREYKKKVEKGMRELSSKMKEKMNGISIKNVDDDLSVECIVNAGENLSVSSSSKSVEYYNAKRSSNSMGGVIERASSTLPSMITLLL